MRASRRLSQVFGPAVVGLAILGPAAPASAMLARTAPAPGAAAATVGQWQRSIAGLPDPGAGCFQASYPTLAWRPTACSIAPRIEFAPAVSPGASSPGSPFTIGNGNDYVAVVQGLISRATGTFTHVSSGITESDGRANTFSLQLNSEFFVGSPACGGISGCLAWQQFIYSTSANAVFIQYWLIGRGTCPSGGWISDGVGDCYVNSPASKVAGGLKVSQLASVSLVGSAAQGGNDKVSLSVGSGTATLVSTPDSKIDLASAWNTTEFNIFGDGGGSEAVFGRNTTLDAQTAIVSTSKAAPACVRNGFTGETNNLNFTSTPALGTQASPTIAFAQTDGRTTTANCVAVT